MHTGGSPDPEGIYSDREARRQPSLPPVLFSEGTCVPTPATGLLGSVDSPPGWLAIWSRMACWQRVAPMACGGLPGNCCREGGDLSVARGPRRGETRRTRSSRNPEKA
eukprot:7024592-Heterocapsa_arctica.AAC.1